MDTVHNVWGNENIKPTNIQKEEVNIHKLEYSIQYTKLKYNFKTALGMSK